MKSARNKTIDITVKAGKQYLSRCLTLTKPATLEEIQNKTICGDTFKVLKYLPDNFVDLLIVDPPYNMSKSFVKIDHTQKRKEWMQTLFDKLASFYQKELTKLQSRKQFATKSLQEWKSKK